MLGGVVCTRGTNEITIPLGSVQTGQSADIVVCVSVPKGKKENIFAIYCYFLWKSFTLIFFFFFSNI